MTAALRPGLLRDALLLLACAAAACAHASALLPPEVDAALARERLPRDAVTLLVADADGKVPARLAHRVQAPVNPASIAKLTTTFAALELLGPAFAWTTPAYADGPIEAGVLQGNLYLKGYGDPKLVQERLWLLLRRLQGLGIQQVAGDIVLDRSAFDVAPQDPGAFDGEPLRPYNAAPDALLVNYRSLVFSFTPLGAQAQVQAEPPLAGVQWPASVPLLPGECGDWRAALKPDFSDPLNVRFAGGFPLACGERSWPLAYGDPAGYALRAVGGLWQSLGGRLGGQVREGTVPAGLVPLHIHVSPPLAEVLRDVNKFSNNVMAQQLFLTLSLQQRGTGTMAGSREVLQQWWRARIGGEPPQVDNGSGLSRDERITAAQLGRLLQHAWASPLMPELVSSLPITGTDGTARQSDPRVAGLAHLKTGSLRDVAGVAGYVHGAGGRRWVLVAIANHAGSHPTQPGRGLTQRMRTVVDALVAWTAREPAPVPALAPAPGSPR